MKNWETLDPDVYKLLDIHYTPGRSGHSINKIVIHHNGGNLSIDGCYNVWQTREASAHYQVESSGRIGQLVNDKDTAWHSGDWNTNLTSIGIEHADISSNPWWISDDCLENGAHLVAAICKYYGLGRPTWMINVFPHSHFSSTACPASLAGDQLNTYMSRAQAWYDAMNGGSAPDPITPSEQPSYNPTESFSTNIHYAFRVKNGNWWPEVTNFNNYDGNGYAGNPGTSHDLFYAYVDEGSLHYQVSTIEHGGFYPMISKADKNDLVNGVAGNPGETIDRVKMYYYTPSGKEIKEVWYRSQTALRNGYLPVVCDDGTSVSGFTDSDAGIKGEPMDRLQVAISSNNPF